MSDRLLVAYALMALMAAVIAAVVWWNLHHSRQRTLDRSRKRDTQRHQRAQAAREPE